MQLLGIRIDSKSKQVAKVLKAGWFPFGKYEEPMGDNLVVLPRIHEIPIPNAMPAAAFPL